MKRRLIKLYLFDKLVIKVLSLTRTKYATCQSTILNARQRKRKKTSLLLRLRLLVLLQGKLIEYGDLCLRRFRKYPKAQFHLSFMQAEVWVSPLPKNLKT